MKYIAIILLSLMLAGCDVEIDVDRPNTGSTPAVRNEYPTVNLPASLRQKNWEDRKSGEGSCVHATMVSLFRWQGQLAMANYWRRTYGGGESADASWDTQSNLADKFEAEGVRYAYTTAGDVGFLQWACDSRRGCGITVLGGAHMVALVHLDEKWAGILDSNSPRKILWVPRHELIAEWVHSNGWAVTPCYTPAPPLPN